MANSANPPATLPGSAPGSAPLKNARHERFAQLIAAQKSRREAYEGAGYRAGSSWSVSAHRLVKRADVTERIGYLEVRVAAQVAREVAKHEARALKDHEARALKDGAQRLRELEAVAESAVIQGAAVLREAALIAASDPTDYEWGEDGQLRTVDGVSPDALRAVSSVKRRVRRIVRDDGAIEEVEHQEFKLWDKPKAIQLIGQHLRLWQEQLGVLLGARVEVVLVDEGRDTRVEVGVPS